MDRILSFDSGTTNTKVFIYYLNGTLINSASRRIGITFPYPLFAEQNCDDWVGALTRAIMKIEQKKNISGISGSFQGGTFVLLDQHLSPLRPAITWLDNRARDIAKNFVAKFGKKFFYNKTGYVPGGWSCIALLRWLKENEPDVFNKTARISFVADYINYFLTGNFVLDHTNAAITTLYNIKRRCWDDELIELAGINKQMLPEIVDATSVIGKLKKSFAGGSGLKEGIVVLAGGHDQYCASLGAGAAGKGKILVSCGTAWVLLVTTCEIVFDRLMQFAPGPHVVPGVYGLMAALSNGGVVYAWGKNILPKHEVHFNKPSGVIVVPDFNTANGAICNLSLSTKPREILQAIIESLCYQVRENLERIEKFLPHGEKIDQLVMIGGASRNIHVANFLATITKKQIFLPEIKEAAGFGAMNLFNLYHKCKINLSGVTIDGKKNLYHDYDEMYRRYIALRKTLLNG
ncbi:MAG TPA: FGGY-family carbohydrate kinase [bacterium]|nr:FGGY-family carbohydrate kinase [bacterium]HOL35374.1 FGGY-family carbohydrate kinase [bacterium]HPP07803.1 FGGY-family carbohydrate kinase [bacterium]